jgi:hypothetical protein
MWSNLLSAFDAPGDVWMLILGFWPPTAIERLAWGESAFDDPLDTSRTAEMALSRLGALLVPRMSKQVLSVLGNDCQSVRVPPFPQRF